MSGNIFEFCKPFGIKVKDPQETFTHLDNEGVARTFLVETMFEFACRFESNRIKGCMTPINAEIAQYMRTNQGVEQDRLDRLADPYLSAPLIGIAWDKEETDTPECTIIDGCHRVVKLHELGITSAPMFVFLYPFWENFMIPREVSDRLVAEGFLNRVSGIIEHERKQGNG